MAEQVANLRRELMIRALVQEEIAGKVKVEDKDVQEYYAAHPDEFSGDTVRLHAAFGFGILTKSLSFGFEVGWMDPTSMVGVRVAFPI